jgi:hypothetical protein
MTWSSRRENTEDVEVVFLTSEQRYMSWVALRCWRYRWPSKGRRRTGVGHVPRCLNLNTSLPIACWLADC